MIFGFEHNGLQVDQLMAARLTNAFAMISADDRMAIQESARFHGGNSDNQTQLRAQMSGK
jgi:hypothetical protein